MTGTQPQLLQIALDRKDVVYTPDWVARDMVEFFKPTGRILEPCAGDGAFLKYLPGADWCEIEKGRDFFACQERYDWIIGNPPYKVFNAWLRKSFEIADDIVYIFPLNKIYNDFGMLKDIFLFGGVVTVKPYGRGDKAMFPMGYAVGAVHFRRAYTGPMYTSFYEGAK